MNKQPLSKLTVSRFKEAGAPDKTRGPIQFGTDIISSSINDTDIHSDSFLVFLTDWISATTTNCLSSDLLSLVSGLIWKFALSAPSPTKNFLG